MCRKMNVPGWKYYNHAMVPSVWPHEDVDLNPIKDKTIWSVHEGGAPFLTRWTSDWDCPEQTEFYWCIKDDGFDIAALKAKRRYEISKGKKNFETRIIDPKEYIDEIYCVYLESLKGYSVEFVPEKKDSFEKKANGGWSQPACRFFGTFDRETGVLCGYSDVYDRGLYLPISSFKTRVDCEKRGVNFALVAGIVEWYVDLGRSRSYLCDGARNALHETRFQDFLIKYFGFRKAYCKLHIIYRPVVGVSVTVLFPFRNLFKRIQNGKIKMIYSVLKMEAWKRGLPE